MIAIELRFPTGKFHATPWGRQVNEGAVEWPPSPWRLLRALLAVWHYKFPNIPADEMQSLFSLLAETPVYHLPPASTGHTRHFMPVANDNRAKIFDTFIALSPNSPVVVIWPDLELSEPQRALLKELLSAISYLGRAESWIDASLVEQWQGEPNAFPLTSRDVDAKEELVRLLAPSEESTFLKWREETLDVMESRKLSEKQEKARQKGKPIEKEKLTPKDRQLLQNSLPTSIFDALHAETNVIRAAGWNYPPGSQWVDYVRRQNAFAPIPDRQRKEKKKLLPRIARFAIASNVRPLFTDAVLIGERVRRAVMAKSKNVREALQTEDLETVHAAAVFSGKDEGDRRIDGHQHAHFFPEAPRDDLRIRYLTVYAEQGFNTDDELALSNLQKVWGDGDHDLQLVLLGIGQAADFGGMNEKLGQAPILSLSQNWVSYTPFIPTDHLKIRNSEKCDPQKSVAAKERELKRLIRKELSRRAWLQRYAQSVEVEVMLDSESSSRWRKFRRSRDKGNGQRSLMTGYGFRIRFPEPVQGPIALGYGCHFGLGQFTAERQ